MIFIAHVINWNVNRGERFDDCLSIGSRPPTNVEPTLISGVGNNTNAATDMPRQPGKRLC
jgi:hypothetical protein